MDNSFITRITEIYPLSAEPAQKLALLFEVEEKVGKGTLILKEGERNKYIIFLKEGFVRAFVHTEEQENTLWFAKPGSPIGAYRGEVSTIYVQALERSTICKCLRSELEELCRSDIEIANWGRKLAEYYLDLNVHYISQYACLDAEKRYELLLKEYPEVLQKASVKEIASYLKIAPQSLSRIRGKWGKR